MSIEKFIAEKTFGTNDNGDNCITVDDLREFVKGKVLLDEAELAQMAWDAVLYGRVMEALKLGKDHNSILRTLEQGSPTTGAKQ